MRVLSYLLILLLGGSFHMSADILYSVTDLGTLGGASAIGYGLNNAGQVVGTSNGHAFLYSSGQMRDLGTLGGSYSWGYSINNGGQVTGLSEMPTRDQHAFLYSNEQMSDLNDLIDPALGITLSISRGINDQGQIVVGGYPGSGTFLLTPTSAVPEPSTLALFGIVLLGLNHFNLIASKSSLAKTFLF